jgi:PAS domain S-box-containing protein
MKNQSYVARADTEFEGEARYRQLFENAPIGIVNVGLDGRPLMVNERAATDFGYASPQDFLENVPSMLDLWVDIGERERAANIMLETGVLRDFEVAMKRRDGTHMMLSVSANPWYGDDGTVVGIQVSGIDITARVRTERRLEEAQSQASIAFWSWRLDTNEFFHTKELNGIVGLRARDAKEFNVTDLKELVHPDDRDMVAEKLAEVKLDPGERFELEFRVATHASSARWLIVRGSVDDDGIRVSGSVQDITQQKLVERKLTELNEMKTEFVSIVAHDLASPLTVANGYAELLQGQWDEFGDPERRGFVDKIKRSLDRLGELVADVSLVTRLESGASAFDIQPFDLAQVVRSTLEDVASVEPFPSWDLSVAEPLPLALGDRGSVWRVLTNLLSNAVKYSSSGEPIAVAVERKDGLLHVSVSDRGPGIALSEQPKLFQKFSRLPSNGSGPRPAGTGLGLFICKSLVEGCGGSIWLESAPAEGSTFTFTLPVAQGAD